MRCLSLGDALFLYAETPETPMHVGSFTIFGPATQGDDLFARFREHVASRLYLPPLSSAAGAAWRIFLMAEQPEKRSRNDCGPNQRHHYRI